MVNLSAGPLSAKYLEGGYNLCFSLGLVGYGELKDFSMFYFFIRAGFKRPSELAMTFCSMERLKSPKHCETVSGFNAAVAGCFFAIETVLRPLRAENSPPFTTAMIILASVISSTVSNVILGEKQAFTVPTYDLKSAAVSLTNFANVGRRKQIELPLYLILGMLCGVVSVIFTRLVTWFSKAFEFIKEKFGIPAVMCPALGGLGAGIIALKYPGILYWGFTNVDEILHTGKSASAPGIWLLAQLAAAKVVATALCKGSGLVGGLYAPSLMIGAAVGAVFGGSAAELINSAIPGNAAVAQPQAYALVSGHYVSN
ncbi:hypothetical protein U1Q18_023908 [Sarracenia purpurea var. burkii]